jgi:uncharacterized protein (DUF433 family)
MSDTGLLDAEFPQVGAAVAKASADAGAAIHAATVSGEEFVKRAQFTVERTIDLGEVLLRTWESFFSRPESGVAERARAVRGDFLQRLGQSLELMRFAQEQALRAGPLAGKPLPGADSLAKLTAAVESIRREALAQWGVSENMAAKLAAQPDVPLTLDKFGDIRVGKSRVLLDTVLEHFKAGAPPEEIIRAYDTLELADVYEVIAYYLRHADDVEAYLRRRDAEAKAFWQQVEAAQPSKADLMAEIKARWSKRKADHAAPAE